jgi:hypothetical protein
LIGTSACRRIGNRNGSLVAERGWKRPFDDPIPLPRGRQLVTLEDAGNYITKLPRAVHDAEEWQAAMEALLLVAAERNGRRCSPGSARHARSRPSRPNTHAGGAKEARFQTR